MPIKQSLSVMLVLFGGWIIVILFAGAYYLLRMHITEAVYLICVSVVLLALDVLLLGWIKGEKL